MLKKADRLSKFLRSAPVSEIRPVVEDLIGSAATTFQKDTDLSKILKGLRDNTDVSRQDLVTVIRRRLKGSIPSPILDKLSKNPSDVAFAKGLKERLESPLITIRHGGTDPELQSILKYGPNAFIPQAPGAAGKNELGGIFVHKTTDALADRSLLGYGDRRASFAGGTPAYIEAQIPEGLLSERGRIGGGEHVVPSSLWRHVKNPKIIKTAKVSEDRGWFRGDPMSPDGVKFKVEFQGIPIHIDRPKGFVMQGTGADGKPWEQKYKYNYGFIPKTEGGDGDGIDVFIGPNKKAPESFWAMQTKPDGSFDEYKVFLGFDSRSEAVAVYTDHIPKKLLNGMVTIRVGMMKAMLGLESDGLIKKTAGLRMVSFLDELQQIRGAV